jgi:tetratricopeptide (TPR) repeat protein
MTGGAEQDQERPTRSAALALARLHLRTGALALARTELETLAGRDLLDDEGILDLAEVRWRTGDVTGAGEAVAAILDGADDGARGDGQVDTPLAWVIAAESAAGHGRPTEARRHAERLRNAPAGLIDAIFAGLPRSTAWPADPLMVAPTEATLFPTAGGSRADATRRRTEGSTPELGAEPTVAVGGAATAPGFWDGDGDTDADQGDEARDIDPELAAVAEAIAATEALADVSREDAAVVMPVADPGASSAAGAEAAAVAGLAHIPEDPDADDVGLDDDGLDDDLDHPDPAEALEEGLAALALGDPTDAAVHLGLALRLDPSLAPRVLDGLEHVDEPQLAFVRGDAYRLLGREREARRAYARARRTSPTPVVDPQLDDVPAADDVPTAHRVPAAGDVPAAPQGPADPSAGGAADPDPDPTQGDPA